MHSRITLYPEAVKGFHNGKASLPGWLHSHTPLDLVMLMLGTLDLNDRFPRTTSPTAPPTIGPLTKMKEYESFKGGEEISRAFPGYCRHFPEKYDSASLDAGEIVVSSEVDGVQRELAEHRTLAKAGRTGGPGAARRLSWLLVREALPTASTLIAA